MGISQQQIRAVLGGPLSRLTEIPVSKEMLSAVGRCLVDVLSEESQKYFALRGWSGRDPKGGPPIWKSFSYRIRGERTLDITSSFYGMSYLASGDIPPRRMEWLTQEAKDKNPQAYKLTPKERQLGMKQSGRVSKRTRLPLVVPIKDRGGNIVLRRAPLKIGDAWVHPGIAKFTFFETALRKWRIRCAHLLAEEVARVLSEASL